MLIQLTFEYNRANVSYIHYIRYCEVCFIWHLIFMKHRMPPLSTGTSKAAITIDNNKPVKSKHLNVNIT
jgi:hypothetical protein